jgi:hypothetical protein
LPTEREPACWFRRLNREVASMEVMLRHGDLKLRASGPEATMFELVEWFEDRTGKVVTSPTWRRPPRSGPRPIPGQVELDDVGSPYVAMTELSSDDTLPEA